MTSAVKTSGKSTVAASGRYIPIPVATLDPETCGGLNLYQRVSEEGDYLLFRGGETPLTKQDLENLRKRDVRQLYISGVDQGKYQVYLQENLSSLLANEDIAPAQRFQMLNRATQDSLREAFSTGDTEQTVDVSQSLGSHTVDLFSRTDFVADDLFAVLSHDFHTFTHSANVCSYSVLLAQKLGISDRKELDEIASAALLHDLGKVGFPWEVLVKPGGLNPTERMTLERHPGIGFELLCHREDLSWGQLMLVYQHHERIDGKGYPVGVGRDEIHPWAQLCSIVDVFDAMTSERPYHRARRVEDVLGTINKLANSGLNGDMVKCWTSQMRQAN